MAGWQEAIQAETLRLALQMADDAAGGMVPFAYDSCHYEIRRVEDGPWSVGG